MTAAAPAPKTGVGREASFDRPNWDTIAAYPEQLLVRAPWKRGESGYTREKGETRPSVEETPALRDLLRPRVSTGLGFDKAQMGKAVR